jgi:Family of unknown function (DUF5372)
MHSARLTKMVFGSSLVLAGNCASTTPPKRKKTRQTTDLEDLPKSVVITRKRHPFEGRSLAVIHSIRQRGVRLVLVILPNGTRSLIPAAWTDWNAEPGFAPISHISNDLGRLDHLLHLRKIINALLCRPPESAPHAGSSHAIAPCLSRADGSTAEPDNTNKPSAVGANRGGRADGRTRAPGIRNKAARGEQRPTVARSQRNYE